VAAQIPERERAIAEAVRERAAEVAEMALSDEQIKLLDCGIGTILRPTDIYEIGQQNSAAAIRALDLAPILAATACRP
jgi:hypothetical protein